jgi:pimeloyl-ACP methyl ester carboxylesterase
MQGFFAGAHRLARVLRDTPAVEIERVELGALPALVLGSGPPLLYLAGLFPSAGVDSGGIRRAARLSASPFARERRVYFLNRRSGLAPGTSMSDLAAEHADAIRALAAGPVDVLGVSTGGSIAQQLAAEHPGVAARLVLVSTGCRLSPEARLLQRRVAERIRAGDVAGATSVLAAGLVPARRGRSVARALARLAAPVVLRGAGDLADLATTIVAEDSFDLAACRGTVRAPTLIVTGGRDRFYEPQLVAETAQLIPGSRVHVFPRRGHVTVTAHPRFAQTILAFLANP